MTNVGRVPIIWDWDPTLVLTVLPTVDIMGEPNVRSYVPHILTMEEFTTIPSPVSYFGWPSGLILSAVLKPGLTLIGNPNLEVFPFRVEEQTREGDGIMKDLFEEFGREPPLHYNVLTTTLLTAYPNDPLCIEFLKTMIKFLEFQDRANRKAENSVLRAARSSGLSFLLPKEETKKE